MRRKLLIAIGSLFLGSVSYSQMTMSDADYVGANQLDCGLLGAGGVNFIDMAGNYSANFDDTITFCPDLTQGTKVSIAFATNIGYQFDIHPTDTLYIFDGPNTSAPLLAAANNATNPTGGNWQASFLNNPSGCLTVRFKTVQVMVQVGSLKLLVVTWLNHIIRIWKHSLMEVRSINSILLIPDM